LLPTLSGPLWSLVNDPPPLEPGRSLVANPPVPPLVLVFFLFMMQNYSAIEDAKPQGLAKTPTKKNLRISEMFDFLGY
jgi:hypothetical protein